MKAFKDKEEKEFVKGFNACIQALSFSTLEASYIFLSEAIENSGFAQEQFEEVQKESGFQEEEMEEIINEAFKYKNK